MTTNAAALVTLVSLTIACGSPPMTADGSGQGGADIERRVADLEMRLANLRSVPGPAGPQGTRGPQGAFGPAVHLFDADDDLGVFVGCVDGAPWSTFRADLAKIIDNVPRRVIYSQRPDGSGIRYIGEGVVLRSGPAMPISSPDGMIYTVGRGVSVQPRARVEFGQDGTWGWSTDDLGSDWMLLYELIPTGEKITPRDPRRLNLSTR